MTVNPGGAVDPASRLERLIAFHDRQFQQTFRLAISTIRNQVTLDALADLLEHGRFEEAIAALESAAKLLGNQYGASLVASAQSTAEFLNTALTATVSFDQTNFRAVEEISRNRLRLIREFSNDQRQTLRAVMTEGIQQGLNPRDQARLFRGSVGLTTRQTQAVANYRRLLTEGQGGDLPSSEALDRRLRDRRSDPTVRRAIRDGTPIPESQINSMVERYQQRYVNYRAETIGRTEALRSVHQGSEGMYQQAVDDGDLDPNAITRTWVTARDNRVRDTHASIGGQERGFNETWSSGGSELRFPGDPNAAASETIQCRCVLTTRLSGNG